MNTDRRIARMESELQRLREKNGDLQSEINALTRENTYKDKTITELEAKLAGMQESFDEIARLGSEAVEDAAEAAMQYREQLAIMKETKKKYETEMGQLMAMLRREVNGKAV